MPQRWAIRLKVQGDLRFLSHRDMMRVTERSALRANLPLHYTQGYNPHPILSLPCPRPVGVASLDDLLVLALQEDSRLCGEEIRDRLGTGAPEGLDFLAAREIDRKVSLEPLDISYRLDVVASRSGPVGERIENLRREPTWMVERTRKAKGRKARGQLERIEIDIKPLLAQLKIERGRLAFRLVGSTSRWAKPQEVLELVGLDEPLDLARLTRTRTRFCFEA